MPNLTELRSFRNSSRYDFSFFFTSFTVSFGSTAASSTWGGDSISDDINTCPIARIIEYYYQSIGRPADIIPVKTEINREGRILPNSSGHGQVYLSRWGYKPQRHKDRKVLSPYSAEAAGLFGGQPAAQTEVKSSRILGLRDIYRKGIGSRGRAGQEVKYDSIDG